ncbi:MAG: LemA protein [Alphaproteobacteria bacterium]|jgi:LemA protein
MGDYGLYIVLGVVALLFIVLYNRIVALQQARKNAFSDIDVQLKQRYNLVPQLVDTVKGYAKHEKELLEKVTNARADAMNTKGFGAAKGEAEGILGGAMMNLMAVAENYPDLKANSNFEQLQNELSDIENKLAATRRFFNNATSEYNAGIQQFPAVILARLFKFTEEEFFELDAAEADAVKKAPEIVFS